ncbi:MAG: hypothetical protein JST54_35090 [Deltaproteobacteria bacterium]|nr:hypothetical protein [Deltaproteobacteria bacterium]
MKLRNTAMVILLAVSGCLSTTTETDLGNTAASSGGGTQGASTAASTSSSSSTATGATSSSSSTATSSSSSTSSTATSSSGTTGSTSSSTTSSSSSSGSAGSGFADVAASIAPARNFSASVVADGNVVLAGGLGATYASIPSGEPTYGDVKTCPVDTLDSCAFPTTASLLHPRFAHVMVATAAGIWSIGGSVADGSGGQNPSSEIELAPGGDFGSSYVAATTLAVPRTFASGATASTSAGTVVYVAGGLDATFAARADLESALVDASGVLGSFAISGALSEQRSSPAAVVVGSCLFITGGNGGSSQAPGTWDSFHIDPSSGALTTAASGPMHAPRTGHAAVAVGNELFLLGGSPEWDPNFGPLDSVDAYSVDASTCGLTYESTPYTLPEARWASTLLVIPSANGVRAYLVSGEKAPDTLVGSVAAGQLP